MAKSVEKIRDNIVDIIVENFDYFKKNPKHMAWAMMNFEIIQRVGRLKFNSCYDNPKYVVLDASEKLSKKDGDVLYDAWGVTVSNDFYEFPDTNPNSYLENKKNKILDEWIQLLTNKAYRYHKLYQNEWRVKDNLLCTIGTGDSWNSEGYIAPTGPSGIDETIYAGYSRCEKEIDEKIKTKILKQTFNPEIGKEVQKYLKKVNRNMKSIYTTGESLERIRWKKELDKKLGEMDKKLINEFKESKKKIKSKKTIKSIDKLIEDIQNKKDNAIEPFVIEKNKTHYPLSEYSNLVRMPKNAHESYVKAGIEIAKEILANPEEEKYSKKYARAFLKKIDKKY